MDIIELRICYHVMVSVDLTSPDALFVYTYIILQLTIIVRDVNDAMFF